MRLRDRAGFTLLEVLAAVAILGIWFVVLSSVGVQGLRAEGDSQRRFRASLLADEALADLEAEMARGAPPEADGGTHEVDDYEIRTTIDPFYLDLPTPTTSEKPSGGSAPALQKLVGAGGEPVLSRIRIEVSWVDGPDRRRVTRETFGLDLVPVAAALAAIAPPPVATEADAAASETPQSLSIPAARATPGEGS
ncbi:MAG: type II secretion system protein [Myxococcota bacterium]